MRWQDYIILGVLVAGYLYFCFQERKPKKVKFPGRELTRKEEKTWRVLKDKGFRLQEVHPSVPVSMRRDGKEHSFAHAGELFVTKKGKLYLVKIKKDKDSRINTASFRRELMLDFLFFQPEAILLFDTEREKLQQISFRTQGFPAERRRLLSILLLILIIIGVVFLLSLIIGEGRV